MREMRRRDERRTETMEVRCAVRFIGDLFEPEPARWGLRGDPRAWRALKEKLTGTPLPATVEETKGVLLAAFKSVVGVELLDTSAPERVFCEALAHAGMSTGWVHLVTWREVLLPLLLERWSQAVA